MSVSRTRSRIKFDRVELSEIDRAGNRRCISLNRWRLHSNNLVHYIPRNVAKYIYKSYLPMVTIVFASYDAIWCNMTRLERNIPTASHMSVIIYLLISNPNTYSLSQPFTECHY